MSRSDLPHFLIPLPEILPDGAWPEDLVASDAGENLLDRLYFTEPTLEGDDQYFLADLTFVLLSGLEIPLPLLGGTSLVIGGTSGDDFRFIRLRFELGDVPPEDSPINEMGADEEPAETSVDTDPSDLETTDEATSDEEAAPFTFTGPLLWRIRIELAAFAIRFGRDLLTPIEIDAATGEVTARDGHVELALGCVFQADHEGHIEFAALAAPGDEDVDGGRISIQLNYPSFWIGDTRVAVTISGVELRFSPTSPLPDWVSQDLGTGVYIEHASVKLPESLELPVDRLSVSKMVIGSSGFSGEIFLGTEGAADADLSEEQLNDSTRSSFAGVEIYRAQLGGLRAALLYFGVTFTQSIPSSSRIAGYVYMPFIEKWLRLEASLGGPTGEFMMEVGGAGDAGLIDLNTEWFEIIVDTLRYELREGVNYAVINGSIKPKLTGLDWPTLKVDKLAISSEGDIELAGGWIDVPETFTLDFHAFKIDISQIGMGSEGKGDAARQWLGLSGGITLIEGLPLSASVEGLKFTWDPDAARPTDTLKVSLTGIALHLEIPNTLVLDGRVSYREITREEAEQEATGAYGHVFTGSVLVNLQALRTEISGDLLIGDLTDIATGQQFTAFYIVLSAELPTAIPLGATGAGLYGLRGLFGMHVAPDRQRGADGEIDSWYLWYKNARRGVAGTAYNITKVVKWGPRFDNYAFGAGLTLGTVYDDGFSINAGALVVVLVPGPVIMIEGRANLIKQRGSGGGETAEGALYALAVFDGLASTFQLNVDVNYSLEDVIEVGGGLEAFFDFNDSNRWFIHLGKREPTSKRIRASILSIITANTYLMIEPHGILFGASVGIDLRYEYGPVVLALKLLLVFDASIFWKEPQFEGEISLAGEVSLKILGIGIGLILEAMLGGKAPKPYEIYGKARVAVTLPFPIPSFDADVEFKWIGTPELPRVDPLKSAHMIHHKLIGASWALADGETTAPIVPVDSIPVLVFNKPLYWLSARHADDGSTASPVSESVDDWEFRYEVAEVALDVRDGAGAWTVVRQSPLYSDLVGVDRPQFDLRRENVLPDVYAQEPQLQLWRYGPLDTSTLPGREGYAPPCLPHATAPLHCVNWRDVPGRTRYAAQFTYRQLGFGVHVTGGVAQPEVVVVTRTPRGQDLALRAPAITINFPEEVEFLDVTVSEDPAYQTRVSAFSHGRPLGDIAAAREGGIVRFRWSGQPLDTIRLDLTARAVSPSGGASGEPVIGSASTAAAPFTNVIEICYKTTRELNLERVSAQSPSAGSISSGALHLQPDHTYRLRVRAVRSEMHLGSSEGFAPAEQRHEYYFKTGGPPGTVYASGEPAPTVSFAEGPLNQLETYVARTIPRDGAPLWYRDYDVAVEFNESYVEPLYAAAPLQLRLLDRNGKLLDGPVSGWLTGWVPMIGRKLLSWSIAAVDSPCEPPAATPSPVRYLYRATRGLLAPNRLYTVQVVRSDAADRALHSFQFATSRFANAGEHLRSGLSDAGKQIVRVRSADYRLPDGWQTVSQGKRDRAAALRNAREALRTHLADDMENVLAIAVALERARDEGDQSRQFAVATETLAALFDDLRSDVLPPVIELTQIRIADTPRSLLLLESPEPLDASRIEWEWTDSGVSRSFDAAWNEDQTRVFLFGDDDGLVNAGTYTMTIRYSGGPAGAPELPPLTRDGLPVDETIHWSVEILPR